MPVSYVIKFKSGEVYKQKYAACFASLLNINDAYRWSYNKTLRGSTVKSFTLNVFEHLSKALTIEDVREYLGYLMKREGFKEVIKNKSIESILGSGLKINVGQDVRKVMVLLQFVRFLFERPNQIKMFTSTVRYDGSTEDCAFLYSALYTEYKSIDHSLHTKLSDFLEEHSPIMCTQYTIDNIVDFTLSYPFKIPKKKRQPFKTSMGFTGLIYPYFLNNIKGTEKDALLYNMYLNNKGELTTSHKSSINEMKERSYYHILEEYQSKLKEKKG